jgi:hypothetical protein
MTTTDRQGSLVRSRILSLTFYGAFEYYFIRNFFNYLESGIRNPESGIRNPESGIRNPGPRSQKSLIKISYKIIYRIAFGMTTLERDVHIAPRRVVEGDAYRPTQVRRTPPWCTPPVCFNCYKLL